MEAVFGCRERKTTAAVPALVRQPVRWEKGLAWSVCCMLGAFYLSYQIEPE